MGMEIFGLDTLFEGSPCIVIGAEFRQTTAYDTPKPANICPHHEKSPV
jgi:hypothetical protein